MDTQVYEAIAKIRDLLLQAGAIGEDLNTIIEGATKRVEKATVVTEASAYNVEALFWENKEGANGVYEMATLKAPPNQENQDFKDLRQDLLNNSNKKFIAGKFYWLFTDGDAIGRKKVARK